MFFNFRNERQKLKNGNLATNNSVYNLLENDTSKSFESIGDDQFCMRRSSDIFTGIFGFTKSSWISSFCNWKSHDLQALHKPLALNLFFSRYRHCRDLSSLNDCS